MHLWGGRWWWWDLAVISGAQRSLSLLWSRIKWNAILFLPVGCHWKSHRISHRPVHDQIKSNRRGHGRKFRFAEKRSDKPDTCVTRRQLENTCNCSRTVLWWLWQRKCVDATRACCVGMQKIYIINYCRFISFACIRMQCVYVCVCVAFVCSTCV